MANKWVDTKSASRGTKFMNSFGRDRSDEMPTSMDEAKYGKEMKGGVDNIDPMIKNGKANTE